MQRTKDEFKNFGNFSRTLTRQSSLSVKFQTKWPVVSINTDSIKGVFLRIFGHFRTVSFKNVPGVLFLELRNSHFIQPVCDKVFKNGPSKTCGGQPLKNLKGYSLLQASFTWSILEYFVPYVFTLHDVCWLSQPSCLVFEKRVVLLK